jgi:hypothetical protein
MVNQPGIKGFSESPFGGPRGEIESVGQSSFLINLRSDSMLTVLPEISVCRKCDVIITPPFPVGAGDALSVSPGTLQRFLIWPKRLPGEF